MAGQAGAFAVSGWVIDPDTTDPVELHVYVDGAWGGRLRRPTPPRRRPRPLRSTAMRTGSTSLSRRAPGTRQVCVYAINLRSGNDNPLLTCRNVRVT